MSQNEAGKHEGVSRREFLKVSAGTAAGMALASWNVNCGGTATRAAGSTPVFTTAQMQILPVPLTAATPQINPRKPGPLCPVRLQLLDPGAGPAVRTPGRPRPRLPGRALHGPPADLLRLQRHPRRGQGIPGPAALSGLGRPVRASLGGTVLGLFADPGGDPACARRRGPGGERPAPDHPLRFRHLPGGCHQQHPVQRAALVHRRHGRQAHHPQLRSPPWGPDRPTTRSPSRPPASTPPFPGTRWWATTTSSGAGRSSRPPRPGRPTWGKRFWTSTSPPPSPWWTRPATTWAWSTAPILWAG